MYRDDGWLHRIFVVVQYISGLMYRGVGWLESVCSFMQSLAGLHYTILTFMQRAVGWFNSHIRVNNYANLLKLYPKG